MAGFDISTVRREATAYQLAAPGWARAAAGALTVLLGVRSAEADLPPAPGAPPRQSHLRDGADLDGWYVWLGPVVAATVNRPPRMGPDAGTGAEWDSAAGGEIAVTRIREHEALGCLGVLVGGERLATGTAGRIWAGVAVGSRRPLGYMTGLEVSGLAELRDGQHARPGLGVGAWVFAGVTPYVRAGVLDEVGAFAELGIRIALPAKHW